MPVGGPVATEQVVKVMVAWHDCHNHHDDNDPCPSLKALREAGRPVVVASNASFQAWNSWTDIQPWRTTAHTIAVLPIGQKPVEKESGTRLARGA